MDLDEKTGVLSFGFGDSFLMVSMKLTLCYLFLLVFKLWVQNRMLFERFVVNFKFLLGLCAFLCILSRFNAYKYFGKILATYLGYS